MEGEGFEPSKAEPSDLQSDPFDRSGTPPNETEHYRDFSHNCQTVGKEIAVFVQLVGRRVKLTLACIFITRRTIRASTACRRGLRPPLRRGQRLRI